MNYDRLQEGSFTKTRTYWMLTHGQKRRLNFTEQWIFPYPTNDAADNPALGGQEKVETTPPDSCQRSKDKSAAFLSVGNTYWNAYFRYIHIFNQIQMLKPKRKEYMKLSAWKLATTQLTSLSFFEKHSNL